MHSFEHGGPHETKCRTLARKIVKRREPKKLDTAPLQEGPESLAPATAFSIPVPSGCLHPARPCQLFSSPLQSCRNNPTWPIRCRASRAQCIGWEIGRAHV